MIYSDKVKFQSEFVDPCLCNSWVGAAVVGAGALGAGATIYASDKAADTQAKAAAEAARLQKEMYDTTRADLGTYRDIGGVASRELTGKLSDLTAPISVNPNDFLDTDYYKFLKTQGEKAAQNSAAARGLGKAGAALKANDAFIKGLNAQEWQNNFNMQNINKTNAFTRLKSLVDVGENAAAMTGTLGEKAAYNQGTALVGGANAQAAGINAAGGAVSKAAGDIGGYAMYKGLYGGGSSSGPITLGGPNGPTPFVTA